MEQIERKLKEAERGEQVRNEQASSRRGRRLRVRFEHDARGSLVMVVIAP